MSELNGYGDEVIYGHPIPGWYLCQLKNKVTTEPYRVGAWEMQDGGWGLTRCNDPDFVFDLDPLLELPDDGSPEAQKGFTPAEQAYFKVMEHYRERLHADVEVGYALVQSCIEVGYDPKEGGFTVWLMHRLRSHLEARDWQPEMIYYHSRNSKLLMTPAEARFLVLARSEPLTPVMLPDIKQGTLCPGWQNNHVTFWRVDRELEYGGVHQASGNLVYGDCTPFAAEIAQLVRAIVTNK